MKHRRKRGLAGENDDVKLTYKGELYVT